ncbi:radical SAM protein [Vallitalea sp.]|jgi:MoaA/NifB/PqqE/SkfB family radical SAM enzyme|uniref:radical SAM protein n=1 Tax=Vallitalea sp. TaxID=1882829 RepID=UPI0025F3BF13|nr:radical SAM protein [Vallitalea sp.]MCT4686246.1 radical SAM protein [Vallitalea sp.]
MNKKNIISLLHSSLHVTKNCTLKCKLCASFSPHYKIHKPYTLKELTDEIDMFFKLVDYVEDFSVTGGEPLFYKYLSEVLEKLMEYTDKIGRVLIFTNGTLFPTEKLQNILLQNSGKILLWLDHYGELSKEIDNILEFLNDNNLEFIMKKYYGEDAHCGGWVDFGNFEQIVFTQQEIEEKMRKCHYAKTKFCFAIRDGLIHPCGYSRRGLELGKIPVKYNEYINLYDDKLTIEQQREKIIDILKCKSLTACAYCNGLCEDSKRYIPAEQL